MHHEHDHVDYDGDENGDDNVDDDVDDDGDDDCDDDGENDCDGDYHSHHDAGMLMSEAASCVSLVWPARYL